MARVGYKMPPAVCTGCHSEGPAKCVAGRQGWQKRGPVQRRRWYCPACPPPPEPAPAPYTVPAVEPEPETPPADPFARLRYDAEKAQLEDAARRRENPEPTFNIIDALLGRSK